MCDSINHTHIPYEVSPTAQSTSGHTRYKGWSCTLLTTYFKLCSFPQCGCTCDRVLKLSRFFIYKMYGGHTVGGLPTVTSLLIK